MTQIRAHIVNQSIPQLPTPEPYACWKKENIRKQDSQSECSTRVSRIAMAQPIATVRARFLLEGVDPTANGQNAGVCGFPSRRLDRTANVGLIQRPKIGARVSGVMRGFASVNGVL